VFDYVEEQHQVDRRNPGGRARRIADLNPAGVGAQLRRQRGVEFDSDGRRTRLAVTQPPQVIAVAAADFEDAGVRRGEQRLDLQR